MTQSIQCLQEFYYKYKLNLVLVVMACFLVSKLMFTAGMYSSSKTYLQLLVGGASCVLVINRPCAAEVVKVFNCCDLCLLKSQSLLR